MYYLNEITNKWLNRYSRNTKLKSKKYRTIGTILNSNIKTVEGDKIDTSTIVITDKKKMKYFFSISMVITSALLAFLFHQFYNNT
jgi:hypothetical protein